MAGICGCQGHRETTHTVGYEQEIDVISAAASPGNEELSERLSCGGCRGRMTGGPWLSDIALAGFGALHN
jgi:hypothetical protein